MDGERNYYENMVVVIILTYGSRGKSLKDKQTPNKNSKLRMKGTCLNY